MKTSRRDFLNQVGVAATGVALTTLLPNDIYAEELAKKPAFEISLAEFSLAGSLYSGKLKNMDFPAKAKNDFGISAVEYVSGFWADKATDQSYLKELKQRTEDLGVRNVLIMVDESVNLADFDAQKRMQAVEAHYKWIEAAKFLGCHSIRVNVNNDGNPDDVLKVAVEGYGKLVEFGEKADIGVIIENHIGISTNPDWLAKLLKQVNNKYAGSLPDFGNFVQREKPATMTLEGFMNAKVIKEYDRYDGVKKLMPFAKGVSAKTHKFDANGNDAETDFTKIMKIVKKGIGKEFKGFVGIEYEGGFLKMMGMKGDYLSEDEGIMATKKLLEKALS